MRRARTSSTCSEVARAVVAAGASTVNIPDTVGYCTPDEFGGIDRPHRRGRSAPTAAVSVHCHNDLGLAVANSLAAVQAGARQVECTINGIGERAGNCAARGDRDDPRRSGATGCRTAPGSTRAQLFPASQLLSSLIAFGPQPNKSIVGRNAFAHEAGIHQDGFLKERTTYEIIDPATVGVPESRLILGKHSGRHALRARLEQSRLLADRRADRRGLPAVHRAGRPQEGRHGRGDRRPSPPSTGCSAAS